MLVFMYVVCPCTAVVRYLIALLTMTHTCHVLSLISFCVCLSPNLQVLRCPLFLPYLGRVTMHRYHVARASHCALHSMCIVGLWGLETVKLLHPGLFTSVVWTAWVRGCACACVCHNSIQLHLLVYLSRYCSTLESALNNLSS